tara:strand:+ start:55 stop:642 length:588 start_codon:yes stop_codon:yes gene_type:complete
MQRKINPSHRTDIVFEQKLRNFKFTFHSTWGLFNPKQVDRGSSLLIDYVEAPPNAECLDLGCGYGPIGLALASLCPQGSIHMIDKDFVAVNFARKNVLLNGFTNCSVYLSNGFEQIPQSQSFDLIASNLPAKVGNELLTIFLHDALNRLKKDGRIYVVTIAGLKNYIKRNFNSVFGNYKKIKQRGTYLVSMAEKK